MGREKWAILLLAAALVLQPACGSDSDSESTACPEGTPSCRCYGNGTCNSGLVCGPNGICGGATGNGGSPGTGGQAGANASSGSAGNEVESAGSAGSDATGGTGGGPPSYMDDCNADLYCWGAAGSGMYELGETQLRKVGNDCLLTVKTPAVELNSDGSTSLNGLTWHIEDDETLYVCDEDLYCVYVCRPDKAVSFPCSGDPPPCSSLPQSICEEVPTCSWGESGCRGANECDFWFEQTICEKVGCTWDP